MFLRDPHPIIFDDDEYIILRPSSGEMNLTLLRDRLNAIDEEVGDGQADLTDVEPQEG